MKLKNILTKTLLIAAFFVSCHSQDKLSKREKKAFYLSMEKTPCFGSCPIYTVSVDNNAEVILNAFRFMKKLGVDSTSYDLESYQNLQNMCAQAKWDTYNMEYLTGSSDLPATIIRYSARRGDTLTVKYESDLGPSDLRQIASELQNQQEAMQERSIN